jgi:hypothetical protein
MTPNRMSAAFSELSLAEQVRLRLVDATPIVEYNYGFGALLDACRATDPDAFMVATSSVTENTSPFLASIQNLIICMRAEQRENGGGSRDRGRIADDTCPAGEDVIPRGMEVGTLTAAVR